MRMEVLIGQKGSDAKLEIKNSNRSMRIGCLIIVKFLQAKVNRILDKRREVQICQMGLHDNGEVMTS